MEEIYRALGEAKININVNVRADIKELKTLFNKLPLNDLKEKMIVRAKEHARTKGGICLYEEYINTITKLEWKCHDEAHNSWFSSCNSVLSQKSWCPECLTKEQSLKQKNPDGLNLAQIYAISKNGLCLSTKYFNNKTPLKWKCNIFNHQSWEAPYDRVVLTKRWCSECANNKKLNGLEEAKNYATSKNGLCLSTDYVNAKTKMEWKCCNNSHNPWLSNLEHVVRRNQWCPQCYKENKKLK